MTFIIVTCAHASDIYGYYVKVRYLRIRGLSFNSSWLRQLGSFLLLFWYQL